MYARAWRIEAGSAADQVLFTVWFFVFSGLLAVLGVSSSELRADGWLAVLPVWMAGSTIFWLWTPRFLLRRRISIRSLLPGALLAAFVVGGDYRHLTGLDRARPESGREGIRLVRRRARALRVHADRGHDHDGLRRLRAGLGRMATARGRGEAVAAVVNPLSAATLLQLGPGLRTRFDPAGHVLVDAPNGTIVDLGPRGYALLSLFTRPLALGEAIERLERDAPSTDFAPMMNAINTLVEEATLVQPDAQRSSASGWADPVEHARMLHDERRTGDYLRALGAAIRPGDVVLDIGTGSGVLAVAAARVGARRVYAVEASDIAEVAGRVFAANGVTDTVTLVPGWSRQIELPEPADVLVAEIIGNEPLEEEILETTLDARRRLLKPDARLIPYALTLLARPLWLPEDEARQRAIGRAAVERWQRLYDMEFQPLLDAAAPGPVNMPTEAEVAAAWLPVGRPSLSRRWISRASRTPLCARPSISPSTTHAG